MKRIAKAPNAAIAALWADLLHEAGIHASVQRQFLSSVAGEIPPDQCLPEIWVTHDEQADAARTLLRQLQSLPQRRWVCACGEVVEGGFESCWNCGRAMP
ncbi:MAG TPA: DUF2007 domain-containing protein [Ramlibacter sp.]|uniref:putative signal transducing protein n=1 Tax=Ramlibacter sp. TaxID=1917967 RepID=UPI002ED4519E